MHFYDELNELLMETFKVLLKGEEKSLQRTEGGLTISEFHLIETIAKDEKRRVRITDLANALKISLPSVTVAVQKLEQKGYVERIKSLEDARSIHIELTERGVKANDSHVRFHNHMVRLITDHLNDDEKEVLYKTIYKMNRFFKKLFEKPETFTKF